MKCLNCWKDFEWTTKYCCKQCFKEYQKVLRKKRETNNYVCVECLSGFVWYRWMNKIKLCKTCAELYNKKIHSCIVCWAYKKSTTSKYCVKCWYEYQKTFVCEMCWFLSYWNSNQSICDKCLSNRECDLPSCNNKVSCWHQNNDNIINWRLFCCKEHFYEYMKLWLYDESQPIVKQWNKIWSQEYSSYWEWAARERLSWLESEWIEYETQFKIDNNIWLQYSKTLYSKRSIEKFPKYRLYDIKVWNILIEISPTVTHNSTQKFYKFTKPWIHPLYHSYSQILAEKNWYHLVQIFDYDNKNKIKKRLLWLIKWRTSINARIVKRIDKNIWNMFCEVNHLQWKTSNATNIWYWLFRKESDQPYAVMWFKCEKGVYTLQRFACAEWYHVPYWAQRMFKQFIKDYNPDYIISQSDCTKHNWRLYDMLWFEREWWQRDYRWIRLWNKPTCLWRRNCQKNNMYKLKWFETHPKWDEYYKSHTEHELMENAWYVWLVNAWQVKHVWFKNDTIKQEWLKTNKHSDERWVR